MDESAALALLIIMMLAYCFLLGNIKMIVPGLIIIYLGRLYGTYIFNKKGKPSIPVGKDKAQDDSNGGIINATLHDILRVVGYLRYRNIDFRPHIDGTRSQQIWAVQVLVVIAAFFVLVRFNASTRFVSTAIYSFMITAFLTQFVVRRSAEGESQGHRYWLSVTWLGAVVTSVFFALVTVAFVQKLQWTSQVTARASAIFVVLGFLIYQISLHHEQQKPIFFGILLSIFGSVLLSGDRDVSAALCVIFASVTLSILSLVTVAVTLQRRTIPWVQLVVGSTVLPFFVAWTAASITTTVLRPIFVNDDSVAQDEQTRLKTLAVRKHWADLLGWQTLDHRPLTVAVSLSGGGYRAAVIHAGLLRALDERCVPIRYLSVVSGGSIFGSFYALGYTPESFAQRLRREVPGLPDQFLAMWNVFTNWAGKRNSADVYSEHFANVFFGEKALEDTGTWPQLLVNATDVEKTDYARETFFKGRNYEYKGLDKTLIADIVAASGAFPGVFQPKEIRWPPGDNAGPPVVRRFVDGGVIENLGYTGVDRFIGINNNMHIDVPTPEYEIISDASAEGATGKLSPKVDLVDLLSRSQDASFSFEERLIRKTLMDSALGGARPTYLFVRALDTDMIESLKEKWYPTPGATDKIDGSKVADEVARYSTLQELDRDQVDKAFWLGRVMGEIRWKDIDKWRRTFTSKPSCEA
jgi:predicted acylesterase/phospholipase RssA